MLAVIDAHIHIQPFHMLQAGGGSARSGTGRTTAPSSRPSLRIPRSCCAQMDADGIERVGLINYVSPDVMGFTSEVNEWMLRYASADRQRLIRVRLRPSCVYTRRRR